VVKGDPAALGEVRGVQDAVNDGYGVVAGGIHGPRIGIQRKDKDWARAIGQIKASHTNDAMSIAFNPVGPEDALRIDFDVNSNCTSYENTEMIPFCRGGN